MANLSTTALAPGTRLKGRYEIVRLIKGGGMSWIYQVREHRRDGTTQIWALKELRIDEDDNHTVAESLHLFEQEAHILVRLDHPNLPTVSAFFAEGQRSYLVMEFVHGESLQERLNNAQAPLLESQVTEWAVQILAVLSYLHHQDPPVIFRDLKPSNVMVTPTGEVKLIDFGIARTYKAGKQRDTISMGSENYAAPEQWGQGQTDPRSDVYALGATIYHLLANEPPLPAFVPGDRAPLRQRNPSVSERLEVIVDKAMAREREDRYQTADEMRQALLRGLPPWERLRLGGLVTGTARPAPETGPVMPAASPLPASAGPAPASAGSAPLPLALPAVSASAPAPMPAPSPRSLPLPASGPMAYCPRCGAGNRVQARFCVQCGESLRSGLPASLDLSGPGGARVRLSLPEGAAVIGRRTPGQGVDLDLGPYDPQGYVSRQHARVTHENDAYWISDLKSSNGTYLNGQRLAPGARARLNNGDRLRMGKLELRFMLGS